MRLPVVTELPRVLEPVAPDPFAAGLAPTPPPASVEQPRPLGEVERRAIA
jgi:hypothetical protein